MTPPLLQCTCLPSPLYPSGPLRADAAANVGHLVPEARGQGPYLGQIGNFGPLGPNAPRRPSSLPPGRPASDAHQPWRASLPGASSLRVAFHLLGGKAQTACSLFPIGTKDSWDLSDESPASTPAGALASPVKSDPSSRNTGSEPQCQVRKAGPPSRGARTRSLRAP